MTIDNTMPHILSSEPTFEELRLLPQWVCYNSSKIPFSPSTGKGADCNDPNTWGVYETAHRAWSNNRNRYAGLGFEFVDGQQIVGVDLDKCVIEGELTPFASDILGRLDSYAEYSPSNNGIHIWVRGRLPNNLAFSDGECRIEMYDHDRYFTVTGKQVPGTPVTINERQGALLQIYEETLERRDAKRKKISHLGGHKPARTVSRGESAYGMGALDDECRKLMAAPNGERNNQLNSSAFVLGQLVAGNELSLSRVEDDLLQTALAAGLTKRESIRTIQSGLEDGLKTPRSRPSISVFPENLPVTEIVEVARVDINGFASDNVGERGLSVDTSVIDQSLENKDLKGFLDSVTTLARLGEQEIIKYRIQAKGAFGKGLNLNDLNALLRQARITVEEQADRYSATLMGMMLFQQGKHIPISNFSAEIVADIETDDGEEIVRSYEIITNLNGRTKQFEIKVDEFLRCAWIEKHLGSKAIVTAGASMENHLINAIKYCSDAREAFHYAHTGWRLIGESYYYLHNGGVVGQVGQVGQKEKNHLTQQIPSSEPASRAGSEHHKNSMGQVGQVGQENIHAHVNLPTPLSRFVLPEVDSTKLIESIQSSMGLMDLTDDVITMPQYAAIWRAPLPEIDFALHVWAQSGVGKSQYAALIQQHFGAGMSHRYLPGSWESTENSLEALMFQAKDVCLVVDDFKPKGSAQDQKRLHGKADRIFRSIGNGSSRGRLDSSLNQRAPRPPRCLLISTGEDVPKGQSLKARTVIIHMHKSIVVGDVAIKLSKLQDDASNGLFAHAMAGYILWLTPQIAEIEKNWTQILNKKRGQLQIEGHARATTNTANLLIGIEFFLKYAVAMGAITTDNAAVYYGRCLKSLLSVAEDAAEENKHESPTEQWQRLLATAISAKTAHLVTFEGGNPGVAYGWKSNIKTYYVGDNKHEEETWIGGGTRIGWVEGDDLYLDPLAAYKAVKEMGHSLGDDVVTTELTLRKFLAQNGLLASTGLQGSRKTITIRRRIGNGRYDVLHVKAKVGGIVTDGA